LDADPVVNINLALHDMYGPGAESSTSLNAAKASTFYDLLGDLTCGPVAPHLKNIPQTRSMAVGYSSPPLPSAGTQRLEGSILGNSTISPLVPGSTPRALERRRSSDYQWLRRNPSSGTAEFNQSSEVREREQSPTIALMQRRSMGVKDPNATPKTGYTLNLLENEAEFGLPLIDGSEGQHSSPENAGYEFPSDGALQSSLQPTSHGQTLSRILVSETNLPSSEPGSTYRPSSSIMPMSSPPIFLSGSSPPLTRVPVYNDRAEESTNTMMYALLDALCNVLSEMPALESAQMSFSTSTDKEGLRIPTGDGGFIKTIPDLKVSVRKDVYSIPILDYEVSEANFLNRICHVIVCLTSHETGRANV